MPGGPVHHGRKVEEPSRHRDIGDVRAPHVVRTADLDVAQQVGKTRCSEFATLLRGRR